MDPRSRDAFLASFNRCRASAGFLEDFYERFVGSSEEVRAKFAGTDMKRQVRMLEHRHPLNHANLSQSTNDVYPTALRPTLSMNWTGCCARCRRCATRWQPTGPSSPA